MGDQFLYGTYMLLNCYGVTTILGVRGEKDGSWKNTGRQNVAKIRKDFWDTINNYKKVNISRKLKI